MTSSNSSRCCSVSWRLLFKIISGALGVVFHGPRVAGGGSTRACLQGPGVECTKFSSWRLLSSAGSWRLSEFVSRCTSRGPLPRVIAFTLSVRSTRSRGRDHVHAPPHGGHVATQISEMQNVASDSDCEAYFDGDKKWMCFMAPYVAVFIQTPVFMLNSFYDTWQLSNILNLTCMCVSCQPLLPCPFLRIHGYPVRRPCSDNEPFFPAPVL